MWQGPRKRTNRLLTSPLITTDNKMSEGEPENSNIPVNNQKVNVTSEGKINL